MQKLGYTLARSGTDVNYLIAVIGTEFFEFDNIDKLSVENIALVCRNYLRT